MIFLSKNEAVYAYRALDALAKRALPTLGVILKVARLKTLLTPIVSEAEFIGTAANAAADKITDPASGQQIIADFAALNRVMIEAMQADSGFVDPGIRLTVADLPKLPEWSDDAEKAKKFAAAREALANEIAALGPFFSYEDGDHA